MKKDQLFRLAKKSSVSFLALSFLFQMGSLQSLIQAEVSHADFSRGDMSKLFKSTPRNNQVQTKINKSSNQKSDFVPGEVLVKFKENKISLKSFLGGKNNKKLNIENSLAGKSINSVANKYNLEKKDYLPKDNSSLMKIKDSDSIEQKIEKLKKDPTIESAQPNYKYHLNSITPGNDTYYVDQWALHNTGQTVDGVKGTADADIDAPEAWATSEGNNSIIAAVIDTGVAYDHPDLLANMWDGSSCKDENNATIPGGCTYGYDYDSNDTNPAPDGDSLTTGAYSHGTHVAGIIAAADNTNGIVGVAPHTKIMAVKTALLTTSEIVKAIAFAENNGAKIINASWGGSENDTLMKEAIRGFSGLFIAAAGNSGDDNDGADPLYPCSFDLDNIVCVAATDQNDKLTSWSSYGANTVDVGAPGDNIISDVAERKTVNQDFETTTVGQIPTGFSKTGNWQVKTAPAELNWGTTKVLFADNSFPYADNANSTFANTTAYNLDGSTTAELSFWTACDTEYDSRSSAWTDYLALELSSDGTNFSEVARWDKGSLSGGGIGYSTGFYDDFIPSGYLTSNFKLRFRWVTNGTNNYYGGCLIDDLKLETYGNSINDEYDYWSGTSMATPQVVGLTSLVWETNGSLTNSQVKNLILKSGDPLADLDGTTVSGKRINAYKALTTKRIDTFDFNSLDPTVSGDIDETNHTISLVVPYGTNITSLVPTISYTGGTMSPATGVAQNFTSPKTYTVTAADGTTQNYTVTVTVSTELTKQITAFDFNDLGVSGIINEGNNTISLTVPHDTNVTSLSPTITFTGESLSPLSNIPQNFTNPVTYTITDSDGFTRNYTVTVTVLRNSEKQITAFDFNDFSYPVIGSIDEENKTINLTVANGTNLTYLTPTISYSGSSISPGSEVSQDFTSPITYTITAEDGSTTSYTVTVDKSTDPYISNIQRINKKKTRIIISDLTLSTQKKLKPTTAFLNGNRVRISGVKNSGNRTFLIANLSYSKWPRGPYEFSFSYKISTGKKSYRVETFNPSENDFQIN